MSNWIIPCNPRLFDVFGAYKKLKFIDWGQSAKNIVMGDIVYIYVGRPIQAIMFKTRVIKDSLTWPDVDRSDEEFNLVDSDDTEEPDLQKRWMRLELVKTYAPQDLALKKLVAHGLRGNIQGPRRVDRGIRALIDLIDSVQPAEAQSSVVRPQIAHAEMEQADKQHVLKSAEDDEASAVESGAAFPTSPEDDDQGDGQNGSGDLKTKTEAVLHELTDKEKDFRLESKPTITVISYQGSVVAKIKYRVSSICVEMDDIPSVHTLYDELRIKSAAYEKSSADPYRWPGKYAFFVDEKDEVTAFMAIIAAAQEGRLNREILHSLPMRAAARDVEAERNQSHPIGEPQSMHQQRATVNHSEDNRRLEKKLDSLIGAIATMYSGKSTAAEPEKSQEEEQDRRFRLEPTQGNAPLLMLRKPTPITGLIFTLRLYGIGLDDNSERYRIFFTNGSGEQLSEPQVIEAAAGGEYNCRFELKSSASEEQTLYLAVQSISAVANEARQLIEFPVKIAFTADFGL